MRVISLVGYSNSGKTTVAQAILAEARRRGLRVAAIKVGHESAAKHAGVEHAEAVRAEAVRAPGRDTERLAAAGADPVVFRTPAGWTLQISDAGSDSGGDPGGTLSEAPGGAGLEIPHWLDAALQGVDLLVIEGRPLRDSTVVQTVVQTVGPDGLLKYDRYDLLIENALAEPLPSELLKIIGEMR